MSTPAMAPIAADSPKAIARITVALMPTQPRGEAIGGDGDQRLAGQRAFEEQPEQAEDDQRAADAPTGFAAGWPRPRR